MARGPSSLHCLCSCDNTLGGSVHAALNVCKHLALDDRRVEVVATRREGDDLAHLSADYAEVPTHLLPRSFPRRLCNSAALAGWLTDRLSGFDVVELHGINVLTTLRAAEICARRGVPYFVRPHGQLDPFDLRKHARAKSLVGPVYVRRLLDRCAGVICTSEGEAQRLVTYGAHPARHVVSLPVPPAGAGGDGRAFRRRHGIPQGARVVLFLSRLDYKKGLDSLIPAVRRLHDEDPDTWLVLAGTGDPAFTRRVQGWLDEHGVRGFTSAVGFVTGADKADAFAAADVFALPSLNENFGIAIVEAMQAGVPVLVSDEVDIAPEIREAGAGLVCAPSVESVAVHLGRLLDDPAALRDMGLRARALADGRYSARAATAALTDLYERTTP